MTVKKEKLKTITRIKQFFRRKLEEFFLQPTHVKALLASSDVFYFQGFFQITKLREILKLINKFRKWNHHNDLSWNIKYHFIHLLW